MVAASSIPNGYVGFITSGSNNSVVVTGSNSLWSSANDVSIGHAGPGNKLNIGSGASVLASNVYLGFYSSSGGNQIGLSGGSLYATNALVNGVLDVRGGTLTMNSGTVTVDSLVVTNVNGAVSFNGGVLNTKGTTVNNSSVFAVGNGTMAATLNLAGGGSGFHSFVNGLTIANNATLKGNGTVIGATTVSTGGLLSPGNSPGSITFSNQLTLAPNAMLLVEMAGYMSGTGYDQVFASTATVGGANLQVQLLGGFVPTNGTQFVILDNFGSQAVGGTFAGAAEGSTNSFGGVLFAITYIGDASSGGSNDILLTVVPEPSTLLLAALGFGCLVSVRRRSLSI